MTYEPLHHKYRPQTFADLVGQEAIATTLTNAIHSRRIVPAYLFTGPRGTGKTSSARILAKSLNCLSADQPTATPCGTCGVCQGITKGSTLDVIEIDAASNTGVDNIRELIERAQFAPVQCRYKVYVIDECHMLSVAAFNALLKTLEEPPERVVFVLATTDPQRVLPTIISRCQRFDFRRIPLEPMIQHLQFIAQTEQIPITQDGVKMVAQIAQGGLRDAESLLDQLSLFSGEIDVEKVWDLVGAVPERDLLELLKAITSEQSTDVIDYIRQLLNRGREPLIVLQNLAEFYRDLLIAKSTPQRSDLVKLTESTWEELCQFAQYWEISTILAAQKYLRESETQIKNSTQPRLWLEIILLGLFPSALTHSPPSVQSFSTPTASPKKPLPQALLSPSPPPPNPVSPPPLPSPAPQLPEKPVVEPSPTVTNQPFQSPVESSGNLEKEHLEENNIQEIPKPAPATDQDYDLEEIWRVVLEQVKPFGTQQLLRQHGRLLSMNTEVACIGFPTQALQKLARGKVSNVEAAFERIFKHSVKVILEVGTQKKNTPASKTSSSEKTEHKPSVSPESIIHPSSLENSQSHQPPPPKLVPELTEDPLPVEPQLETPISPIEETSEILKSSSQNSQLLSDQETLKSNLLKEDRVALASKRLADVFSGKVISLSDFQDQKRLQNVSNVTNEERFTVEANITPEEDQEDQTDEDNVPF